MSEGESVNYVRCTGIFHFQEIADEMSSDWTNIFVMNKATSSLTLTGMYIMYMDNEIKCIVIYILL